MDPFQMMCMNSLCRRRRVRDSRHDGGRVLPEGEAAPQPVHVVVQGPQHRRGPGGQHQRPRRCHRLRAQLDPPRHPADERNVHVVSQRLRRHRTRPLRCAIGWFGQRECTADANEKNSCDLFLKKRFKAERDSSICSCCKEGAGKHGSEGRRHWGVRTGSWNNPGISFSVKYINIFFCFKYTVMTEDVGRKMAKIDRILGKTPKMAPKTKFLALFKNSG